MDLGFFGGDFEIFSPGSVGGFVRIFGFVFRLFIHLFLFDSRSPRIGKILTKCCKGEQNQGIWLLSARAFSERFSDDFGMVFVIKNR